MKAIILAAGFGTRLLPFTRTTPKPLFPVAGRPLIDRMILTLIEAGCDAILVNSHHLYQKIDDFLSGQRYSIPVETRYEPEILGTGGAIKNAEDFWNGRPFMAVNGDIVTDISLKRVYDFHRRHHDPATLVLFDDPEFNTVTVDERNLIVSFDNDNPHDTKHRPRKLTFTGIQVLDPAILDGIPENTYTDSIDVYRDMLSRGLKIRAYVAKKNSWKDIGTPERYASVVFENMAPLAFRKAFSEYRNQKITSKPLAGDGSDRLWFRLVSDKYSLVMVDHGIRLQPQPSEIDSFIAIGEYLFSKGMPVPRIFGKDDFSGLVFLEDLGDLNLQTLVRATDDPDKILSIYGKVIDLLIRMSMDCATDFAPQWAYQTPAYSRQLILEKECRYFVDAFLNQFAGMTVCFEDLEDEFKPLAAKALEFGVKGFMHRDFQSRNIMIKNNRPYLIDFQGGRIGPIQYDLASLLLDPYVELPLSVQARLSEYCADRIAKSVPLDREGFLSGYRYCAITRNLQILGAFGYLSRVKGKCAFERYIPAALRSLRRIVRPLAAAEFPRLDSILEKL